MLMNVGCECDDQAGQQHEPADSDMAEPDHAALGMAAAGLLVVIQCAA